MGPVILLVLVVLVCLSESTKPKRSVRFQPTSSSPEFLPPRSNGEVEITPRSATLISLSLGGKRDQGMLVQNAQPFLVNDHVAILEARNNRFWGSMHLFLGDAPALSETSLRKLSDLVGVPNIVARGHLTAEKVNQLLPRGGNRARLHTEYLLIGIRCSHPIDSRDIAHLTRIRTITRQIHAAGFVLGALDATDLISKFCQLGDMRISGIHLVDFGTIRPTRSRIEIANEDNILKKSRFCVATSQF